MTRNEATARVIEAACELLDISGRSRQVTFARMALRDALAAYDNATPDTGAVAERQRIADVVWHWEGTRLDLVNHIRDSIQSPVATDNGTTEPLGRQSGFDVGAGSVREGDTALYEGRECKVLTVYQDGDVQIEVPTYPTVKWRYVTPLPTPTLQEKKP